MRLNIHNVTRTDVRTDPGGTVVVRLWVDDHDSTLADATIFFADRDAAVSRLGQMFAAAVELDDPLEALCPGSEMPANSEAVTAP